MMFTKKNEVGLGASTAIFSFFGILIGLVILNWKRFETLGYNHGKVIFSVFVILLLNIFTLSRSEGVDHYAHGGGFISGITLGLAFADLEGSKNLPMTDYEARVKKLGLLATSVFFASSFILYYLFT